MANYTTNLKNWGSSGQEYPDSYAYIEDEAPVDAWDNFVTHNLISDVKDHLIPLSNSRIESDSGGTGDEPTNPDVSHLYYNTTDESLNHWNETDQNWDRLLTTAGDSLDGSLDFSGYAAKNVGPIDLSGDLDLAGSSILDGNDVLFDASSGQFADADTLDGREAVDLESGASDSGSMVVESATDFNFDTNLNVSDDGDGTVSISAENTPDTHTAISEDGTEQITSVSDINFTEHLNVVDDGDGSITLDPTHNHDSRYVNETDHSRYTNSEAVTAVNNETSLSVDISGDADTLDGVEASGLAKRGVGVEHDVYANKSNVPTSISKGEVVFIDGDGLYVEQ